MSSALTHRPMLRSPRTPAVVAPKLTPVVAPVVAAGAAITALAVAQLGNPSRAALTGALVLLVTSALSEAFPVPIQGVAAGATSLATIFIVATAVLYSWQLATLVGVLTMLFAEGRSRKRPIQFLYNTSLYALSAAAAGGASLLLPAAHGAGLTAASAFYVTDLVLLSAVIARTRNEWYGNVVRSFVASTLTPFVVMASTTAILVELWRQSPFLGLLVAPPLVAIAVYQRRLEAASERQRELDRLKEEFVAVVSHELRTPLASVYGGVQTLQRRSLPDDARERVLDVIRHEAVRLAKLVDDVLWASRLDARPKPLSPQMLDPDLLISDVVASTVEVVPENLTIVVASGNGGSLHAAGDPEQVRRVLANLVENAVKYSPEGGRVEVGARVVDDRVRFVVRDEGIGIPMEEREWIFEKFTRLDPQMVRGVGGTGLGLYICRELIEQMDGRIWAEANVPKGSAFTFELPVAVGDGDGREAP